MGIDIFRHESDFDHLRRACTTMGNYRRQIHVERIAKKESIN